MEKTIKAYLDTLSKKRFRTVELIAFVEEELQTSYWEQGGYLRLVAGVNRLLDEDVLRPVKAWKHNGMHPPLYNGYAFMGWPTKIDKGVRQRLLTQFHPRLNITSYLKAPEIYQQEANYLAQLDNFLKTSEPWSLKGPQRTINERSFEIFQDEKFLASASGQAFLDRVGLDLDDLFCHRTYEPFFYYQHPQQAPGMDVLIIENKDTFFTFKALLQSGITTWGEMSVRYLIYGEGNKILRSFGYFYEIYSGSLEPVRFWYFGDLDPAGINIWYELNQKESVLIQPVMRFYETMTTHWRTRAPKLPTKQLRNQEAVEQFLRHFLPSSQSEIRQLLEANRYLPQEALHGEILQKLAMEENAHAME